MYNCVDLDDHFHDDDEQLTAVDIDVTIDTAPLIEVDMWLDNAGRYTVIPRGW
jgi:hypothetical protein